MLAEQLFQAYLDQILVEGFFHADPHPGNVLHTPDGMLALIDVGMVSSRGESHPPALAEPDVNLSAHPAPIAQPSGGTSFQCANSRGARLATLANHSLARRG